MAQPIELKIPTTRGEICISVDPLNEEVSVKGARAVDVAIPFCTYRVSAKPDDAYVVRTAVGGHDGDLAVRILRQGQPWWTPFHEPALVCFSVHGGGARLASGIHVRAQSGNPANPQSLDLGVMPLVASKLVTEHA